MDLSPRQQEIARMVAQGFTEKQIAQRTGLSPATVHAHIRAAANRLEGDSRPRTKLTSWAIHSEYSRF